MTLRVRLLPRLPTRVIAGDGFAASVENGNLNIALDYRPIYEAPIDEYAGFIMAVQDPDTGSFISTNLSALIGTQVDGAVEAAEEAADSAAADAIQTASDAAATAADVIAADAARVLAETARDSSFANAKGDTTIALARARVADGETFIVYASGGLTYDAYRRESSSTQTLLGTFASAAGTQALAHTEAVTVSIPLEDAVAQSMTSASSTETIVSSTARVHSPVPAAQMVVTPLFHGVDLDTPVVPVKVTVTGKNIVNAAPALWEAGQINTSGVNSASTSRLRTIGYIPVAPDTQYVRRGGTVVPTVTLYDDDGNFTRQINDIVGTSDVWVTAANETRMRLFFVAGSGAIPSMVSTALIQVEKSAVPTTFEAYRSTIKTYEPVEIYRATESVTDTIEGSQHIRRIERRTVGGTTGDFVISNVTTPATVGAFYRALILLPANFSAGTAAFIIGRSDDGDYVKNAGSATEARGIFYSASDARITVEASKIDGMSGANLIAKFQAYLNAHPVEVIFDLGSYAVSAPVASGLLVLPPGGSVLVEATYAADFTLQFREVASGGGGGSSVLARVTALEMSSVSQAALVAGLQTQIDDLIVSGDSSVEAAAARTSFLGLVSATLKARLDRMEKQGRVDVADFGAVGDGMTDDTDAILAARDAAEANGMALYFPACSDHYMISRGIRLHGSTQVVFAPGAALKKLPAFTSAVSEAVSINQTVIPVVDASGFEVGFDVYVGPATSTPSYNGTRGVITAVDLVNDTISIESYNSTTGTGMRVAYAEGEAVASTTFPMIYTDNVVTPGVKISPELIRLHLNGNAQPGEPNAYTCSLIHLDAAHVVGAVSHRCILRNSPADALSDQGDGLSVHAFNRMYSNTWHGIHIGFTSSGHLVFGNYAKGNGRDGMYYCFTNSNTRAIANFFEDCPIGFAEIGGDDGDTILSANTTKNCGIDYEITGSSGVVQIVDMLSIGNTGKVVTADSAEQIKITGVAKGGSGIGIELIRCTHATLNVDFYDWTGTYCVDIRNAAAVRSSKMRVSGIFNGGASTQPIRIRSSDNVLVNDYVMDCGGAYDVVIAADSGQSAPSGVVIGAGILNAGISDGGTGTVNMMA